MIGGADDAVDRVLVLLVDSRQRQAASHAVAHLIREGAATRSVSAGLRRLPASVTSFPPMAAHRDAVTSTRPTKPQAPTLTEKAFLSLVIDAAKLLHWKAYHPFLSIRSERGFPDLTLIRAPRLVFAELKSDRGKPTERQTWWLEELARCDGTEVYLWRPKDWDELVKVLR